MSAIGKIRGTIGERNGGGSGSGKLEKYAEVRGGNGGGNGGSRDNFAISKDELGGRIEKDLLVELSWWIKIG